MSLESPNSHESLDAELKKARDEAIRVLEQNPQEGEARQKLEIAADTLL